MISHRHRCVFVHQRKCAGTSIIRAFGLTPEDPDWHVANDGALSPEFARIPADYLRFAVIRNPWDRFVSGWKYCASTRQRDLPDVLAHLPSEGHDYRHLTRPQHETISHRDGTLAVDVVLRFETLQSDFDALCDRIGMPRQPLQHLNRTARADYRKYFDPDSLQRFNAHFAIDIARFGYTF
ncbi:MAG TPA: sulfotransferase family 2 domain-containing protein [Patescibacteria group bacterium]|nr:sulfotransferase family 2 domain-containing protein [Patescibacteria group bacterium]